MKKLNLKKFDLKIKIKDNKRLIFDCIRNSYFHLTKEEWVRQNVIQTLINEYDIPKSKISVEKGFKMAMSNGVLAGFPLNTLKVRLYDGSYHDVDSDALSFELAAQIAFKSACKLATPKILEPIMKLSVITPEINMGDVIGDLNRRRGQVEGMDDKGGAKVVSAKVPLSEMFGYITDLRTITSGRATSTMEFFDFVEAPKNISDEVIKKVKGE